MTATAGGRDASATPAGGRDLIRTFARAPLESSSWRALLAILLGFLVAIVSFSVLSACFSAGGSLLIWLIGIPIVALGIEACRIVAGLERWRATYVDHRPLVPHPYRPLGGLPNAPYGPWLRAWAEAEFLDPNRWRDVIYVLVLFPSAMLEFAVAVSLWATALGLVATPVLLAGLQTLEVGRFFADRPVLTGVASVVAVLVGFILIPAAAWASRGLMVMHRAVVEGLLCVDASEALRQDVARLRGSRSAALELEASELRRIERDLHDGAQQRLVALAIDLGLAEERLESDPASARVLVASAREQARQALADLRDLIRGTAPSILIDRGLVAALAAVAGGCPVPTSLDSDLPADERLPPAVERAAYFVVAEALANVAKHSEATRCEISLTREGGRLVVEIRDDGAGGATAVPGGGLAGLRDRVGALDGAFALTSPTGGPTTVHVEFPLAG